jgi:hypothetical protein
MPAIVCPCLIDDEHRGSDLGAQRELKITSSSTGMRATRARHR